MPGLEGGTRKSTAKSRQLVGCLPYQRPLRHRLKQLRRLNKELARRSKGGKNWQKTKSKVARLHYRIACLRADFLHKLTTEVAETSGLVAVEDLHIKGLIQNRCLSRAFSDAALASSWTY